MASSPVRSAQVAALERGDVRAGNATPRTYSRQRGGFTRRLWKAGGVDLSELLAVPRTARGFKLWNQKFGRGMKL